MVPCTSRLSRDMIHTLAMFARERSQIVVSGRFFVRIRWSSEQHFMPKPAAYSFSNVIIKTQYKSNDITHWASIWARLTKTV